MAADSMTPERDGFFLDEDPMALPRGASAKTKRRMLRYNGHEIFGLSQGQYRPYLFPVYTPKGFAVTAESPADHPHHNSIWVGSDKVQIRVPVAPDRFEDYSYNFYVNETFQGRAAGTIQATATTGKTVGPNRYDIRQSLEWRGPPEWGAPQGRVVAHEQRTFNIRAGRTHHVIDMQSALHAAEWDLLLGPTRHAYFNVRAAESMDVANGGNLRDADGRNDAQSISASTPGWVDLYGPVGGGHGAGITVMAHPASGVATWFVTDWGVMTVGQFRHRQQSIAVGESLSFGFRVVIRDGEATDIAALYREYVDGEPTQKDTDP